MFEKLKQSLPESLRKKMGSEEESEGDESVEYSEEESEESHDTSANEPAPEDKKKKQISMLIRVVVVIGLGYLAATEFIFKPEPQNNELPAVAVKRKPRKKPQDKAGGDTKTATANPADTKTAEAKTDEKKPTEIKPEEKKPEEKKPEELQAETKKGEPVVAEAPKENPPVAETQPPVENINIAEKAHEEKKPEAVAKPEEKPIDEAPVVKTPEVEPTSQVGEVKNGENKIDKTIDSLIENMDSKEKKSASSKKTKLEDKIVADDVYTPPPAYDQLGRGLVYNCKEKFWACLDKAAYVACNKNMKWNKAHGKPAECTVQNVYNSDEDCNTIQKYNVSTNKPTTFCE